MKSVINKNTGEKLFDTVDYNIVLTEDMELVDFIPNETEEVIEIPQDVALWKIRAILKSMGLEEQIEQSFELLEEPNKTGAKYIWEYGTSIERQSKTVLFLQMSLNMTDEQVNQIFINANNIQL